MSFFEPKYTVNNCGNCKWIDTSIVLTSMPPQARCKFFGKPVFVTSEICLSDMDDDQEEKKEGENYGFNTEDIIHNNK